MTDVILETPRLRLTSWDAGDAGLLHDLLSTQEQTRYLSGGVWTREKAEQRLCDYLAEHERDGVTKYRLVERGSGRFIGRAGFSYFEPEAGFEIGYSLQPQSWGNGFASEIAQALRDWFFARPIADRFIGFTHPGNAASMRVLQKIGMRTRAAIHLDDLICPAFEIEAGQVFRAV